MIKHYLTRGIGISVLEGFQDLGTWTMPLAGWFVFHVGPAFWVGVLTKLSKE